MYKWALMLVMCIGIYFRGYLILSAVGIIRISTAYKSNHLSYGCNFLNLGKSILIIQTPYKRTTLIDFILQKNIIDSKFCIFFCILQHFIPNILKK